MKSRQSSERFEYGRRPPARGTCRSGIGLVDIIVAAVLMSVLFAFAAKTFFYERKSASYTSRLDNLRSLRIIENRISRDLQQAVEFLKPSYGTSSYELWFRDDRYDLVRYMLVGAGGQVLRNESQLTAAADGVIHLVRTSNSTDPSTGTIVARQCRRLRFVRFCRLGRNMMGFVITLRPKGDEPGEERTLRLDSMVTISSPLN